MNHTIVDGIPVWGTPLQDAIQQMLNCMTCHRPGHRAALMADHHLGYAVPVGGVIAYSHNYISPSGVGFDIACGNKAVLTDAVYTDIKDSLPVIMDDIARKISFGVGRVNDDKVDSPVFDLPAWELKELKGLKKLASDQLGTVGSGNHYVDLFRDKSDRIWIGVHFGSRGLGHKIASHFIKEGGGVDGMFVDPVVLDTTSELGKTYIAAMHLAGQYAYAGRDWVCSKVASIIGADILEEVHNHHNYAWEEEHYGEPLWVVRKGATPAFPGQKGFVGGSMGEPSVILEGVDSEESKLTMYSTVHGAGRILSRTQAAGKTKWSEGKKVQVSEGLISKSAMMEWVNRSGVILRGAGVDESPHCYKRLSEVLDAHMGTIKVLETLWPIGVAMAGPETIDPYKD